MPGSLCESNYPVAFCVEDVQVPGSLCESSYPVAFCVEAVQVPGSPYEVAYPVANGGLRRPIGYPPSALQGRYRVSWPRIQ